MKTYDIWGMYATKNLITTLVLVLLMLGFGAFANKALAASLYPTASTSKVYLGGTFTVYPRVNTGGQAANSFEVNLSFPSSLVQPISISKGSSICTLFAQEPSYTATTAKIICGLPSPGYNGSGGSLGSITFKGIAKGVATISVTGSKVLANDGLGTNLYSSGGSVAITITDPPPPPVLPPAITSSTGASGEWQLENQVTFSWTVPSGVTGFSFSLSKDQGAGAGRTNMGMITSKTYLDLTDGTYYFKVAATNGTQWSSDASFSLLIDRTPPENLQIEVEPDMDVIDRLPLISFNATDASSGIDHYEIKIDGSPYVITQNPYQVQEISSGKHTITVKAVDMAGNFLEKSREITVAEVAPPEITSPIKNTFIPLQEKLKITGEADPNAKVILYLNGEVIGEVTANGNGYFEYLYDKLLFPGNYEVYAVTKNESGLIGISTNTVPFNIDPYALRFGGLVIPSFTIIVILLIIFLTLFIPLLLLFLRRKKEKKGLGKIIAELEAELEKKFEGAEDRFRKEVLVELTDKRRKISKERLGLELEGKVMDTIDDLEDTVAKSIDKLNAYDEEDQKIELKEVLTVVGSFKEKIYKATKKITISDWIKDLGVWIKNLFSKSKKQKKKSSKH